MIEITDRNKCSGCGACCSICPKQAISMIADEEGFIYPRVDNKACIQCGLCENACSFLREKPLRGNKPIETYAMKNTDDDIRKNSSSGGVFSALASKIIHDSGIVYGVAMSDDMKTASHIRVDNEKELYKLRGSKYLQAEFNGIFYQVKKDLEGGKQVLFSGVPCQINGLKLFLRKEYDNLFLVEVICHGTPSPKLWEKYANHLENKYNGQITYVNFREKRKGWKSFGLTIKGANISQYFSQRQDPYMQMFLKDYCLRPSCYDCVPKKLDSMADLTIADFWGINSVAPGMDDNKGVSLVLVQTKKGESIIESIKTQFSSVRVNYDDSIKSNPAYWKSSSMPYERRFFFQDMNSMSFDKLQTKYCKTQNTVFIKRVIRKTKSIIKRVFGRGGGINNKKSSRFEYGLLVQLKRIKK